MGEAGTGGFQNGREIAEAAPRLILDVTHLPGLAIAASLARREDQIAQPDRLIERPGRRRCRVGHDRLFRHASSPVAAPPIAVTVSAAIASSIAGRLPPTPIAPMQRPS